YDDAVKHHKPIYLFSGFLLKRAKMEKSGDTALAFAIRLAIRVPMYEVEEKFWLDSHFEGGPIFADTITFHVRPQAGKTTLAYGLASRDGLGEVGKSTPLPTPTLKNPSTLEVPLG